MKIQAYTKSVDYYFDQLKVIDGYLSKYAKTYTQKMHTSGKSHLKKAFTSHDEIESALKSSFLEAEMAFDEKSLSEGLHGDVDRERNLLQRRIDMTLNGSAYEKSEVFLPFEYLSSVFNLSDFERFVVMLSFSVELDRKYEKIFGYLNDYASMRYPTVQTACLIYDDRKENYMKHMTKFHSDSKLMKYFFEEETGSLSGTQLKLLAPIKGFLLDSDLETIVLPHFISLYLPDEKPKPLLTHLDIKDKINMYLSNLSVVKGRRIVMNIHGPAGIGKLKQVKHFCHAYKHSGVIVSAQSLYKFYTDGQTAFEKALKQLAQTLLIHQAVLVISDVDIEVHRDLIGSIYHDFLTDMAPFVKVTFALSTKAIPPLTRPDHALTVLRVELDYPQGPVRKGIMERLLETTAYQVAADMEAVASKFVFTPDQIENAIHDAVELSKWEGREIIDSDIFHRACRSQLHHDLDKRAQRIEAGGDWNRLVLPDSSKDTLFEVCSHIKYKNKVLDEWGFKSHLSYGTGLAVLFAGPPGTGKTFSARILAKELNLELYKVDLSQMISKYIGETEKNISALFEEASGSSAILLFDEGDALFGKRTEMKDSHDKYANVETAFLLQKVEAYEGISILTTNFMQNIDPAFLRRFRFVVHFPIPDADSRLDIWKSIYPKQVPVSKHVDFGFLAKKFELTGGHIKNIALSSAFKAASEDSKVDMKAIMLSIQHELSKTGKAVLRSDFGEYAYMLDG